MRSNMIWTAAFAADLLVGGRYRGGRPAPTHAGATELGAARPYPCQRGRPPPTHRRGGQNLDLHASLQKHIEILPGKGPTSRRRRLPAPNESRLWPFSGQDLDPFFRPNVGVGMLAATAPHRRARRRLHDLGEGGPCGCGSGGPVPRHRRCPGYSPTITVAPRYRALESGTEPTARKTLRARSAPGRCGDGGSRGRR